MRIAVVTTHYANNYGALLQTYALQKFLNDELKQDAEALAYYPPWHKVSWVVFNRPRNLKELLKQFYLILNVKNQIGMRSRSKKNKEFIKNNIRTSEKTYYYESEIIEDNPNYDCYICGSDQVWNLRLRQEPVFFLSFTEKFNDVKKIAYAPSVVGPIPDEFKNSLKGYLENLDAISVRENSDIDEIAALIDKPVYHVADPVFLLRPNKWSELAVKPKIEEPYIFCYFISSDSLALKAVKKLRELTGYPVVHANVNARDKFNSEHCIWDADPFDFIGYIKNAAFVCTNSFHCSAFSMIFKKDYYVVPKSVANTRMESLHEKMGIENRFLNSDKIDNMKLQDLPVDYSNYDKNYEDFISSSIEYLKRELGVDNDD